MSRINIPILRVCLAAALIVGTGVSPTDVTARAPNIAGTANTPANPILFVTQVPMQSTFGSITAVFGNHLSDVKSAPRGGDLMIRYPDGSLKNLTAAAGWGSNGFQGANSIAVRDPHVHWDGAKALFSMVIGSPAQRYQVVTYYWQIYEITGLGPNDTPVVTKVANQPQNFNNVSPIYGSDDRIIFTSDRPRNGEAHLYPQLDEYELAPTNTGLWSLDRTSGDLKQLNHAPSGNFNPSLDSFGRVVFSQWDHMQRDQQADADGLNKPAYAYGTYGTFNFSDESANAAKLQDRSEIYPEPRPSRTDLLAGTNLAGHNFNHFFPWTINEDGTESEVLNHLGRHELHSYIPRTITGDANIDDYYGQRSRFNPNRIMNMLMIKESPSTPGTYYGIDAPEFGTRSAGQVISITAPPGLDADHIAVNYVTRRETANSSSNPNPNHTGLYRDVLPMSDGTLVTAHTLETRETNDPGAAYAFRIKTLKKVNAYWESDQALTTGISKTVTYWDPDQSMTYSGLLWEFQPVEVRSRTRPASRSSVVESPEQQMFSQAGVSVSAFQAYLQQNNLALVVVRNNLTRDDFDFQQPFRLQVGANGPAIQPGSGTTYRIDALQFFQADQLRGWGGINNARPGRRVLAQPLHDSAAVTANAAAAAVNAIPNSVAVNASDGSAAAFVPARRATTWQLVNEAGTGVVRERYWLTFQPGEIRTCASCHGLSDKDQMGNTAPTNPPQALYDLLVKWKTQNGQNPVPPTATATTVNVNPPTATATPTPTATAVVNNTATPTPTATATQAPPPTATATATQNYLPSIINKTLQQGQNGYTGVSDTNLYNWSVNTNNGSNSAITTSSGKSEKSLLRFDLADIPTSSVVQSATLQLFLYYSDATAGTRASELHKLNVDWLEMQATHSLRKTGVAWAGNGPQPNSDYATAIAAIAQTGKSGVWVTWDVTALVQAWVSNPASNFGALLIDPAPYADSSKGGYMRAYRSSNHWEPAARPKLNVTYTTAAP